MKAITHKLLGRYIVENYFTNCPKHHVFAFLFGCIQPDRNPATYLKGSLKNSWFHGHHYDSAKKFLSKLSDRLEKKKRFNIFDYYTLGKLIHYTSDAFTYAHNRHFPDNLTLHRNYETRLQKYFSEYIKRPMLYCPPTQISIKSLISSYHSDYIRRPANIMNDAKFTHCVCCLIVTILQTKQYN